MMTTTGDGVTVARIWTVTTATTNTTGTSCLRNGRVRHR